MSLSARQRALAADLRHRPGFAMRALLWCLWLVLRAYACTRPRVEIARGTISRWFLTSRPTDEVTGPSGFYLHKISARDYTDEEHFHPWAFARTLILRGGYTELRSGVPHARRAGDFADFVPADFHVTVHVLPNTWTLFFAGPKSGLGWGFREYPGGPVRKAAKGLIAGRAEDAPAKYEPPRRCDLCGDPIPTDSGPEMCGRCIAERS